MDLADMAVPIVGPCEPTATVRTDIIPLVVVGFLVVYNHILSASTLRTVDEMHTFEIMRTRECAATARSGTDERRSNS
jgi:hypothetical protein